jgi:hypothetical protein
MFAKILMGLLVLVSFSFAAAPTGESVDANYIWEIDTTISDAAGFDTISGDDSIVLAAKYTPEPGWQYILVNNAITEGSEAEFILNIAVLDEDGDVLYVSSAVDTLTDDGGAVLLPFGETLIGTRFRLVLVDGGADVGTNVLNTVKIYRRRLVTGNQVRWR